MIYDITLKIEYLYQSPVSKGRHTVCVAPSTIDGVQRLLASDIAFDPEPDEKTERQDFFGNHIVDIGLAHEHAGTGLAATFRVERLQCALEVSRSLPFADLPATLTKCRSMKAASPLHFLAASPRVSLSPLIGAFARDAAGAPHSVFDAVLAVGQALFHRMTFDATATDVDTSPEEAFTNGSGVCQDFAHIMIAALRSLGIPAGYVSGYLRTLPPEGMERLEGADAMHAWVRAWCGDALGWVEFDPTNDLFVGTDHIVAAYGRDYSDVAPIRGVVRLSGAQDSTHSVDVAPVPEPA